MSSYKINPKALVLLLESNEGPVGREVRQRAEAITENAKFRAKVIMHRRPSIVDQEVDFAIRVDGTAVVGIRNSAADAATASGVAKGGKRKKTGAEYLAEKEAKERVWLVPAVRDVFS